MNIPSLLEEIKTALRLDVYKRHNQHDLLRKCAEALKELQKECEKQARLNGAGASREARLMARVKEMENKPKKLTCKDHEPLVEAINRIACWDDGDEVTGKFDSPWAAKIARTALFEHQKRMQG